MKLGEILVAAGKVTADQVESMLAYQSAMPVPRKLGELLIDRGFVSRYDVIRALGQQFHMATVERLTENMIDAALIERLPVDWARQHLVFPARFDGEACAMMADPSSLSRVDELALLTGQELVGILAPPEEIRRLIDVAFFERKGDAPPDDASTGVTSPEIPRAEVSRADDLLRTPDSAPVTRLMNGIILEAVRKRASDIHIEPFEQHMRIRYRIDGILIEQPSPPKDLEQALISRLKVMSKLDIAERRLPQDGMAKVRAGEREIDIRVSTVPVAEGERVVLRLLNQSSTLLSLSELGMPANVLQRFDAAKDAPNGIILVTGPTGSGKTTTLYAALRAMDTKHRNVMTIEDPIEYQVPDIGQIQVKPKIGLTFASGLRHILRQDPDVILVGEIRDQETAEIAVRAALTGHLVFSTLHTNDAVSAVERLVDMGIPPYLLASSVRAIVAQRLVRRLCPECRRPVSFGAEDLAVFPASVRSPDSGITRFEPVGCSQCMQGYRGRVGIYEMFSVGDREQAAIRGGTGIEVLRKLSDEQLTSLWRDAWEKVTTGLTSIDEVRRVLEASARVRLT